jgi:hypothetical protein
MKEVLFLPPADRELEDAIQYYNDQLEGLGDRFFREVMEAIDTVQAFPLSWAKIGKRTHRMILKRFP